MRKYLSVTLLISFSLFAEAQSMSDSLLRVKDSIIHSKDSILHATFHADSVKLEKEFAEKAKWQRLLAIAQYPVLKGTENSGVIPVKDPTEIPDPNIDYKILFEMVTPNPDSMAKDINPGLDEIARVINLHVASGIPAKRIMPVVIVHGSALNALKNNEAYRKKYKVDNPNLKLIGDLVKFGVKFIACGQAMAFFGITKEDLLPEIKISLTAQTVLTHYQLKGYVWRLIQD